MEIKYIGTTEYIIRNTKTLYKKIMFDLNRQCVLGDINSNFKVESL